MANVYPALDSKGNTVAIKILKEEVSDKEKILGRFKQASYRNVRLYTV
jgi:hypothetical protein